VKSKIFLLLFGLTSLIANSTNTYVLADGGILDQRAQEKIKEIGDEVKEKLHINMYVDLKGNNGIDIDLPRDTRVKLMREKELMITKNLKAPYAVLVLSIDQMYTSILMSDDLKNIIDKDEILGGYVIPLLASKDKNTLIAKSSAAALNGFAQIADTLAESKNIKLKSSIGNEGKITSTVWKVFMYTMVVFGILSYIVIIMREKKYKNMTKEELRELEKNGK